MCMDWKSCWNHSSGLLKFVLQYFYFLIWKSDLKTGYCRYLLVLLFVLHCSQAVVWVHIDVPQLKSRTDRMLLLVLLNARQRCCFAVTSLIYVYYFAKNMKKIYTTIFIIWAAVSNKSHQLLFVLAVEYVCFAWSRCRIVCLCVDMFVWVCACVCLCICVLSPTENVLTS